MILKNLECIECGEVISEIDYYNRYNKTEAQIRTGHKCDSCKKEATLRRRRRN